MNENDRSSISSRLFGEEDYQLTCDRYYYNSPCIEDDDVANNDWSRSALEHVTIDPANCCCCCCGSTSPHREYASWWRSCRLNGGSQSARDHSCLDDSLVGGVQSWFVTRLLVHCDGSGGGSGTEEQPDSNSTPVVILTNNEKVLTSLVAGALAGAVAKTTIAPLDRTKIFFQTSPSTEFNARSVMNYLHKSYKSTGFTSLWRGNSATMARIIPYAAIQFTAHEQWKSLLLTPTQPSEITRFLCGSLAGVTAQSLTYPLDLTRARLAVSPISKYTGLSDVFVKTVKGEGLKGLFKGYVPTMLGVVPYAGCSFYCYEGLKRVWMKEFGGVSGLERLAFGALAGVVGQSCSYPFDIVRRRLQTGVVSAGAGNRGLFGVFRLMGEIGRTEGIIRGLYKGLSMNWVKGPVAAGISFACYDWGQQVLRAEVVKIKKGDS